MKTLALSVAILTILTSPVFAWENYASPPAPGSGFGGYSTPAPNPPQSMWMQQVGPNTELYQNPNNPAQGGVIQQVGPGTSITTPNDGSPPVVCQQNGPMTVCN